jgi:hypothetical protein
MTADDFAASYTVGVGQNNIEGFDFRMLLKKRPGVS